MTSQFPKAFYGDIPAVPPATTKNQLQWYLFLRVLLLTVMLGISVILQTKSHNLSIPSIEYTAYFIAGIYLFTIISAVTLKIIENYKRFALFQTIADVLLVGVIVYATGCSQSIFTILYFLPILTGSFLLLRTGGLLIASVATMSYGYILMIELLYDPLPIINKSGALDEVVMAMHYFAIHGLVFFMLGVLSFIIFERMHITESALTQTTLNYDRLQILYRQIFADITTGIITVDDGGKITSFNQAAAQISSYKEFEVYGKGFYELFPGFKDVDKHKFRQSTKLRKKDGSTVPIGFSWARLNMPGEHGDCRVYTMQDLSKIKDMERQVKQAEKMATIGEMAAVIAHEFRNPLAAISGSAQILQHELPEESANRRLINIVIREGDRLDLTVGEFLLFSKPAEPIQEWLSIKPVVDDIIQMLEQGHHLDQKTCRAINKIAPNLAIWADPKQLKIVLVNLISNSCQAFSEGVGEITIEATEQKQQAPEQDGIVIKISDNGPGIDKQTLPKIFDPFYTTRESGTGLGLAIVGQLIESHSGRITVTSTPNKKTAFTIFLPLP